MGDYISRGAALEALQDPELFNVSPRFLQILRGLPAADVEPVRHVRIAEGDEQYVEEFGWFRWFRCSTCYSGFNITGHPRYCPYCGGKAVFESGPPIPVEHVEATEEEAEAFFQALENTPKPVYPVRHGRWEGVPNAFVSVASKDGSYHGNATTCSACHEVKMPLPEPLKEGGAENEAY